MYLGLVVIDEPTNAKITGKHHITFDEVRDAVQWPAHPRAKWDDHPKFGRRLIVIGQTAGKSVLCILKPLPEHDENADTWEVKTARWLRQS